MISFQKPCQNWCLAFLQKVNRSDFFFLKNKEGCREICFTFATTIHCDNANPHTRSFLIQSPKSPVIGPNPFF